MQRLKTRPQFQAAMAGGVVSRTPHFVLHRLRLDAAVTADLPPSGPGSERPEALFGVPGTPEVWMGAMVPKRWARRAVTRNTIKRQIYALSLPLEARLPLAAYVVRLRTSFDRKQFISATSEVLKQAVREELVQLFARVTQVRAPKPAAVVAVAAEAQP